MPNQVISFRRRSRMIAVWPDGKAEPKTKGKKRPKNENWISIAWEIYSYRHHLRFWLSFSSAENSDGKKETIRDLFKGMLSVQFSVIYMN